MSSFLIDYRYTYFYFRIKHKAISIYIFPIGIARGGSVQ